MNLVSAVVGLSIMGIAAPTVLEMSVAPIIAQKRATNFSKAESSAVIFAAKAEATGEEPNLPDQCTREILDQGVKKITCFHGNTRLEMSASRTYRVDTSQATRKPGPYTPGVFCPPWDPDGTDSYDNDHNVNCNPNYPS